VVWERFFWGGGDGGNLDFWDFQRDKKRAGGTLSRLLPSVPSGWSAPPFAHSLPPPKLPVR